MHTKHITCHIRLSFHAIVCLPHTHSVLGQAAGNSICFRSMVHAHTIFYLSMLSMSMHMSHASSQTCMPQPLTFVPESIVWPPGLCYQRSISFSCTLKRLLAGRWLATAIFSTCMFHVFFFIGFSPGYTFSLFFLKKTLRQAGFPQNAS